MRMPPGADVRHTKLQSRHASGPDTAISNEIQAEPRRRYLVVGHFAKLTHYPLFHGLAERFAKLYTAGLWFTFENRPREEIQPRSFPRWLQL
jgi:hypothetical protein